MLVCCSNILESNDLVPLTNLGASLWKTASDISKSKSIIYPVKMSKPWNEWSKQFKSLYTDSKANTMKLWRHATRTKQNSRIVVGYCFVICNGRYVTFIIMIKTIIRNINNFFSGIAGVGVFPHLGSLLVKPASSTFDQVSPSFCILKLSQTCITPIKTNNHF